MAKRKKRIRDLVEMLEYPEESRYIGEDKDKMDLYDEELAKMEEEELEEDDLYIETDNFQEDN